MSDCANCNHKDGHHGFHCRTCAKEGKQCHTNPHSPAPNLTTQEQWEATRKEQDKLWWKLRDEATEASDLARMRTVELGVVLKRERDSINALKSQLASLQNRMNAEADENVNLRNEVVRLLALIPQSPRPEPPKREKRTGRTIVDLLDEWRGRR